MSLTLHALHVLARAGGGQSFGGGGDFSGGGYYGGGGSSVGFGGGSLVLGALFGGPGFVLIVIVLTVLDRVTGHRGGPVAPVAYARPLYSDLPAVGRSDPKAGLAAIAAHDPAFDAGNFLSRVQRIFFLVQQAWTERKPEISRRVMADALWQQHNTQIQQYVERNQRNVLDSLAVGNEQIVGATSDKSYDTITVWILAASADYDVDVTSGKLVRGDHVVRRWAEDWTFQRSAKAVTRPDGGTLNDKCPNCGAPLSVDLQGVCSYCHAQIMAGDYDWVLIRIAQV